MTTPRFLRWLPAAIFLGALGALAVLIPAGCSENNPSLPEPENVDLDPYPIPTSPTNILAAFERAYEERNLTEYIALFSEDFVMDSDAVPAGFWTRDRERTAARNMFEIADVDTIVLNFTAADPRPTATPGLVDVDLDEVLLLVQDRREGSYRLLERALVLQLRENPQVEIEGQPTWEIVRWTPRDPGVVETTWVDLKVHYYSICPNCR